MKDYSITTEDKKRFILRLKFTDTSIIACMADGSENVYPNDREELITLLERMKQQVLDADIFLKKQNKRYKYARNWLIFVVSYMVFLLIYGSIFELSSLVFFPITALFLSGGINDSIDAIIKSKRNINDVMKHRLYLENVDALNNCLTYDFSKVSEETKNLVMSGLDINKVDKINRKEMEYIVGDRPKGRIRRRF